MTYYDLDMVMTTSLSPLSIQTSLSLSLSLSLSVLPPTIFSPTAAVNCFLTINGSPTDYLIQIKEGRWRRRSCRQRFCQPQENLYRKPHSVERSEAGGQKCISAYLFSLGLDDQDPSQWDDAELSHLVVPEVEYPSDGEEEEGGGKEGRRRRISEEEEERNRHVASCGSLS